MILNKVNIGSRLALTLFVFSPFASADWDPEPGWKDSYAVDGRCYCDSNNYDHKLDTKTALTPIGEKNVVDICNDIEDALGAGPTEGRIPYNDIQCGNGPANDAPDEAGCPGRIDIGSAGCNIIGPKWDLMAVYGDGVIPEPPTPAEPNEPNEPNEPAEPAEPAEPTDGRCNAQGPTLSEAIQAYAASCPGIPRRDCDPTGDGQWTCSSGVIGANAPPSGPTEPTEPPAEPTEPPAEPTEPPTEPTEPPAEPTEPPAEPTEPPVAACEVQGSSLNAAIQAYALNCPDIPRRDCDPDDNGLWTCSSTIIGASAPSGQTEPPAPTEPPSPTEPPVPTEPPAPTEPPGPGQTTTIGKVDVNDLVSLHYDNCPDRDDGHALAAGKAVVVRSGLGNVMVVNGTCADNIRGAYQRESENVARAVWGSQWLDYYNDGDATIQTTALRWADVLSNGGDVWVAEGGPSDFTAKVLRSIGSQFPSIDRKNIYVVQHSTGNNFNEARTSSENIALVKEAATYVPIPNGNGGGNGSAGLRESNQKSFFIETALQSEFSNEWNAAFDYYDPNAAIIDFSDTVELLYMIEDTETGSIDDFARNYLQ